MQAPELESPYFKKAWETLLDSKVFSSDEVSPYRTRNSQIKLSLSKNFRFIYYGAD